MKLIHPLTKLMCAVACAVPMIAMAQYSPPASPAPANVNGPTRNGPPVAPAQATGDSATPRSTIGNNPTIDNGQAPNTTSTTDDGTNVSKTKLHRSTRSKDRSGNPAPAGEEPTYPAKTKDGRPTSDSSDTISK